MLNRDDAKPLRTAVETNPLKLVNSTFSANIPQPQVRTYTFRCVRTKKWPERMNKLNTVKLDLQVLFDFWRGFHSNLHSVDAICYPIAVDIVCDICNLIFVRFRHLMSKHQLARSDKSYSSRVFL